MKRAQTKEGVTPRDRCPIRVAAAELAQAASLEAVSIDRVAGRVSVATFGRAAAPAVGERIALSIGNARSIEGEEGCQLLQSDSSCGGCPVSPLANGQEGFVVKQEGCSTTVARFTCPTAPRFWRWRDFPLPMVAPRRIQIPEEEAELNEWRFRAVAAAVCAGFGLAAFCLSDVSWSIGLYSVAYLAGGCFAAKEVWQRLKARTLDVHFLMLAVAAGSGAVGAWSEGTMLLFLFSSSGALECYAMGRTQREIRSLFRTAPTTATSLDSDGHEHEVPVDRLKAGDRILIKPGSQFPVDAEIVKGKTASDESNLTGEAYPVEKAVGDSVLAGTINLWGVVEGIVLRPVQESALEKIILLIREAQHLKAPSQRFTDKFGTRYTYAILGLSLIMFFVWWQGMGLPAFAQHGAAPSAFYHTMTLLVVASPCALVLSIPSAVLAAIAWGAKRGILFRGGAAVEKLAEVNVVALDKTGTLTTGELKVEGVESFPPGRETEVSRLAFSLERLSTHPLARAISRHGKQTGLAPIEFDHFESVTGLGLRGSLGAQRIFLGRREWLESEFKNDRRWRELSTGRVGAVAGLSEVWVGDGDLLGRIWLRDDIRPESALLLDALQQHGIHVVVLTGDRPGAALALQGALGLADVRSELKPEQKVEAIRKFTSEGRRVAMVGDGVNDAPSLAVAHVGVAMGARGSDAALEQAEVVLMHDRLENFMAALRVSQAAHRVIRQNLVVSLGTVAVLVAFATFGKIPLTAGVLGHEGSTVIVVLNSLRLLFTRLKGRWHTKTEPEK
jgi:Zn2+/Cd2+-exporting ATPase